ncbi:DUF3300 domain-containing protein [Shewanella avicenniae]|uniref:DUF3300 domain-containing protein n=1 Tax=Shewanella avicenniae TaxID=2814294 RepID=A0ABX7QT37_9GAMM|nr:DUF3300 domain-containing protein [Shewanella avicenniae]QSX34632.1 DUF3300 domain-containing protein [Shewanella avicenniae]
MITVMRTPKTASFSIMMLLLGLLAIGLARPTIAAETDASYSDAEVAQLMSPIALYPDTLLTHVLIAASYPLEVVQAQRWRNKHSSWSNDQLTTEGAKQGWDPSVVALLAFPDVLNKMSDDLDWTEKVGEAFVANEGQVMDSIQSLRQAAYKAGNLQDVQNIKVEQDQQRIVIVPASPTVVYVPYYDTRYVYGNWYWGAYPPVYWDPFPGYVIAPHSLFYWRGSGVHISFNFFFGGLFWHDRTVWVDYGHRHTRYIPVRRHHTLEGQRWAHRPEHRRGIHYRSTTLNQRYQPHLQRNRDSRDFDRVHNSMSNHRLQDARHYDGRDQRHTKLNEPKQPQRALPSNDRHQRELNDRSREQRQHQGTVEPHNQLRANNLQAKPELKADFNRDKGRHDEMTKPGFKSREFKTEQVRPPKVEPTRVQPQQPVVNVQRERSQPTQHEVSRPNYQQVSRSNQSMERQSQPASRGNNDRVRRHEN